MTKKEYAKYVSEMEPKSPHLKNLILAFVIGGAICAFGELIMGLYQNLGATEENASALVSVTLIGLSALLTGFGLYNKIAKHAGAGTLVPITGFANSIASTAIEFKSEGFILGMCANMFKLAGPVLVMGVSASVLYGVILVLFM